LNFNKNKNFVTCQSVVMPHGNMTKWCSSDNDTCHLYHFQNLNLVPLF